MQIHAGSRCTTCSVCCCTSERWPVRSTPAHVFRENNILETQKQLVQVPVSLRRLVATPTGARTQNPRFRRMWIKSGTSDPGLRDPASDLDSYVDPKFPNDSKNHT